MGALRGDWSLWFPIEKWLLIMIRFIDILLWHKWLLFRSR
jgi:hypothetical protein